MLGRLLANGVPTQDELARSTEEVAQAALQALATPDLIHSHCAAASSSSDGPYQAPRLFISDAETPMSAKEPQSLFLQVVKEFPKLLLTNCFVLTLSSSLSCLKF